LPPQFGHRSFKTPEAQDLQKVHSNEQITASRESGGKSLLQHSQLGRNSSIQISFEPMSQSRLSADQRSRPVATRKRHWSAGAPLNAQSAGASARQHFMDHGPQQRVIWWHGFSSLFPVTLAIPHIEASHP
jgi:hypothetical protein